MSETCDAEWAFDVNFDVTCPLPAGHDGLHTAFQQGNGGVFAVIQWPTDEPA